MKIAFILKLYTFFFLEHLCFIYTLLLNLKILLRIFIIEIFSLGLVSKRNEVFPRLLKSYPRNSCFTSEKHATRKTRSSAWG